MEMGRLARLREVEMVQHEERRLLAEELEARAGSLGDELAATQEALAAVRAELAQASQGESKTKKLIDEKNREIAKLLDDREK